MAGLDGFEVSRRHRHKRDKEKSIISTNTLENNSDMIKKGDAEYLNEASTLLVSSSLQDFNVSASVRNSQSVMPDSLPQDFTLNKHEKILYAHENIKHMAAMLCYKTEACKNNLCPGEARCPYYHSDKDRRRIPRVQSYTNGLFFSYNACRCQAMEKNGFCDKGESCRYSHTKEEIPWHPSRYKTAICSFPARNDGICSRYGAACPFALNEADLRKPIILTQGSPHRLVVDADDPQSIPLPTALPEGEPVIGGINSAPSRTSPRFAVRKARPAIPLDGASRFTLGERGSHFSPSISSRITAISPPPPMGETLYDFVCPPEDIEREREFYINHYKTEPCPWNSTESTCNQGLCPYYHAPHKRRRSPKEHLYSADACPYVKDNNNGWLSPNNCPKGEGCDKSHSMLESMFNPSTYKTVACSNFIENDPARWLCRFGRQCSHAHTKLELRDGTPLSRSNTGRSIHGNGSPLCFVDSRHSSNSSKFSKSSSGAVTPESPTQTLKANPPILSGDMNITSPLAFDDPINSLPFEMPLVTNSHTKISRTVPTSPIIAQTVLKSRLTPTSITTPVTPQALVRTFPFTDYFIGQSIHSTRTGSTFTPSCSSLFGLSSIETPFTASDGSAPAISSISSTLSTIPESSQQHFESDYDNNRSPVDPEKTSLWTIDTMRSPVFDESDREEDLRHMKAFEWAYDTLIETKCDEHRDDEPKFESDTTHFLEKRVRKQSSEICTERENIHLKSQLNNAMLKVSQLEQTIQHLSQIQLQQQHGFSRFKHGNLCDINFDYRR